MLKHHRRLAAMNCRFPGHSIFWVKHLLIFRLRFKHRFFSRDTSRMTRNTSTVHVCHKLANGGRNSRRWILKTDKIMMTLTITLAVDRVVTSWQILAFLLLCECLWHKILPTPYPCHRPWVQISLLMPYRPMQNLIVHTHLLFILVPHWH